MEHEAEFRAKMEEMDSHFQKLLYKKWFQDDVLTFLHKLMCPDEDDFIADLNHFRVMSCAGVYWCYPGEVKKYITLTFMYRGITLAYEQDNLDDTSGHVRLFRPTM